MGAPAIFQWKGSRSDRFQDEGITRDISVAGVYVLTTRCPPMNSVVQMELILPSPFGASKPRIKAEMRVLRVEHHIEGDGRSGFSAVGKAFALRDTSKQPSDQVRVEGSVEKFEAQK